MHQDVPAAFFRPKCVCGGADPHEDSGNPFIRRQNVAPPADDRKRYAVFPGEPDDRRDLFGICGLYEDLRGPSHPERAKGTQRDAELRTARAYPVDLLSPNCGEKAYEASFSPK